MSFTGFLENDFQVFQINGLDERMEGIRNQIQPKFKLLGESLRHFVEMEVGNEMFLHIAKHARRTVNPPNDTWLAICHNKRGYKKHPHFQVGLFDDRLFIWLAYIYELPNKSEIASKFLTELEQIYEVIPKNYVISLDHMKKNAFSFAEMEKEDLEKHLIRFRDVKKAEFLIGQHIDKNDLILADGVALTKRCEQTFKTLLPLYKLSLQN